MGKRWALGEAQLYKEKKYKCYRDCGTNHDVVYVTSRGVKTRYTMGLYKTVNSKSIIKSLLHNGTTSFLLHGDSLLCLFAGVRPKIYATKFRWDKT